MRKILIPTDFSDNAMNAIQYALELFKYERSDFFIMHAYQDEIYADASLLNQEILNKVTQIISNKSQKQLENTLKKIKEISPNPRHTYNMISSNSMLMDEADKIVDDENIDIIVMGTRGETNDRKLTFGSHTLQVLKYVLIFISAFNFIFVPFAISNQLNNSFNSALLDLARCINSIRRFNSSGPHSYVSGIPH